ncbi:CAZyme family GH13 [Penicillium subrubescens]|uniref:CAZyme family GH13 n=1 Tax=Penicillium subrubescens TaxID=1316194 RepID=UPI002545BB22|nr:CAZyme family GH13 [Penicillium subrubescens]KAJ5892046.1 CAZyme family GH13 [Penicillium subrubescens]
MLSLFSCWNRPLRRRQRVWKEKEEAAKNLDQLPSWTAPDNTLILQAFEWHVPADRRHWNRLKAALPDYKALGVDQIWVPPGCKGMDPAGNGYDIYDLYDLGEFDQKGAISTKWGSRKELEDLVCQAQALDIKIIWDAVLNHKAGADFPESFEAVEVDPKRRDVEISKPLEIDGWVGFDFSGRGDVYSSMKYHWQHFSGVDWDDKRKHQAIYKVHAPHKNWASDVSGENGNYDYLMFADLDLSHPEVREDILQWGTWITDTLSLSGMRLDAAKHFSAKFQKDFVNHIRSTANPDFFVIGEYWTGNVQAIMDYLEKLEYDIAAYDVPLIENFSKLSHIPGADLRDIFKDTLVERRPDQAVTIVANHDTQPGQMLETPVASDFKLLAYALILLRKEGHPCVFYGDIYGIRGGNTAPPMAPACNGKLPILTKARKLYAYGEQEDYFDQPNCIGFVRYGNARHRSGLACVISNAGAAKKRMFIGRQNTNQRWIDILGHQPGAVVIDKRGYGLFPVNSMSASVWIDSAVVAGSGVEDKFNINIYDY